MWSTLTQGLTGASGPLTCGPEGGPCGRHWRRPRRRGCSPGWEGRGVGLRLGEPLLDFPCDHRRRPKHPTRIHVLKQLLRGRQQSRVHSPPGQGVQGQEDTEVRQHPTRTSQSLNKWRNTSENTLKQLEQHHMATPLPANALKDENTGTNSNRKSTQSREPTAWRGDGAGSACVLQILLPH